ncbi:MAG: hypothetical protein ACI9GW_002276, partial [Halieaceae bacterium]
ELFHLQIADNPTTPHEDADRRWHFRYGYISSSYSDYLDGTKKLSLDDVLFAPGEDVRTQQNFPVVPHEITQEVHAVSLGYDINDDFSLNVTVPYVKQQTDHISVVPGYDHFNISSKGLGDIIVVGRYSLSETTNGKWNIGLGLSFPTGGIDEQGDTPKGPGDQQLPYSMQLGSGTYDIPAYIAFSGITEKFRWGVDANAKVRLGSNDRDYCLGNSVGLAAWIRFEIGNRIAPSMQLSYTNWGAINGKDEELVVPGAFPYPAGVLNPRLYGGQIAELTLALDIPDFVFGQDLRIGYSFPVYQSLNGPQPGKDYSFSISFTTAFM